MNRLTFTFSRVTGLEVMTQACAARADAMERRAIVDALNALDPKAHAHPVPYDSCYTTGELARDLINLGAWCRV